MKLTVRTIFAVIFTSFWAATIGAVVSPAPQAGASAPAPQVQTPEPATAKSAPSNLKPGKNKSGDDSSAKGDASSNTDEPYVIGVNDLLEITVWDNAKLSGFRDVGPDGMISMPLIGEIKADGLTKQQLTDLIRTKLLTLMEDPEVLVQVPKVNSKKFYIYTGCMRNGEFPLVGNMTVLDALASCGGFREFANPKKAYILRDNNRIYFNFKDLSQGKHPEQNIRLRNLDKIFIPE